MSYDLLLNEAYANGITIKERPFKTYDGRIKNQTIYLRQDMNTAKKSCVLAEELGHYYTTVGDILDQGNVNNRKQELRARIWAYNKQIGLYGIIQAYKARMQNSQEVADYLGVTLPFLQDAIEYYHQKYGICTTVDNYIVFFEPCLAVMESVSYYESD